MNTRFAPTPLKEMHLGHLILSLINRDEARARGGSFILRLEDEVARMKQPYYKNYKDVDVKQMCDMTIRDMEWAGVKPDYVSLQSDALLIEDLISSSFEDLRIPRDHIIVNYCLFGSMKPQANGVPDVFSLFAPLSRLVMDHLLGCDPIIRGDDLMQEEQYHWYLCNALGIEPPELIFIPRIRMDGSDAIMQQVKLSLLRSEGWSVEALHLFLLDELFDDPQCGFLVSNLRDDPILSLSSKDMNLEL